MLTKTIRTKQQNIVGQQQYANTATGEVIDCVVITKNITRDYNFHKIWLQDILNVLDSFGNKKIAVISGLLKIMRNEDNSISGSQRELAKMFNVSLPTLNAVMKELVHSNVIKKVHSCTYKFNPDLIVKGSSSKRQKLLIEYKYAETDETINRAQEILKIEE